MELNKILINTASSALKSQKKDGSMPHGFNGPHNHPETPVRNTCHWAIVFLKVFEITKDEKFKKASEKCMEYILEEKKKFEYNLPHRDFEGKDRCNGLIGPAWTMEALILTGYEEIAGEIFLLHSFDEEKGLWHRREVDGKILGIDWTFNHQLWFASIASMLDKKEYPEVHRQIGIFIEKLDQNFDIWEDGLIWHPVALMSDFKKHLSKLKSQTIKKKQEIYRAIGYHQFNLYAFGILKENYPNISFWKSEKFKKALEFLKTEKFEKGLEDNKYGFDYNVAGIEIAFVLKVFEKNSQDLQKYWLEKQFQRNYDFEKNTLSKNTADGITLTARIYEATRLENLNLEEEKFLTVIIPVYKDPDGIRDTLESLKKQSLGKKDYEIIVTNDGGDDETQKVCEEYGVKVLRLVPNKGSYVARNEALKEAKGEYIAFIDADIEASENWLEKGRNFLKKYDYVGGDVKIDEEKLKTMAHYFEYLTGFENEKKLKNFHYIPTANLFVKRKVFDKVGFFKEDLFSGGDSEFGKRVYEEKKFNMHYSPELYVTHPPRGLESLLKKSVRVTKGSKDLFESNPKKFKSLKPSLLNIHFLKSVLSPIFKVITSKRKISVFMRTKLFFWSIWFSVVSFLKFRRS